jgi:chemotaxis protein methyltransferase CheR
MRISSIDFRYLQDTLVRVASIRLEDGKKDLAESRLSRLCTQENIPSLDSFFGNLRSDKTGRLVSKLIEVMTTHETYFFRDVHPFDAIKSKIIPTLMAQRERDRSLRILSAACSTGQEAYSLAMLIADGFPELASWSVDIVGTDLCGETVAKAEKGVYTGFETARGLPEAFQSRYFDASEKGWTLRQKIRSKVRFQKMNLLEDWSLTRRFDLICIRNVLIYFEDADKKKILQNASKFLQPEGYLMLGSSETILNLGLGFREESIGITKIFRMGTT